MSNEGGIVNALYSRLLLRDFFGKVVPGAVLLVSALSSFIVQDSGKLVLSLPFSLWLFALGISWLLGFAVQSFGEQTQLIRHYPKILEKTSWRNISSLKELDGKNLKGEYDVNIGYVHFQEYITDFSKTVNSFDDIQQKERFSVIKEACGNGYVALLVATTKILGEFIILNHGKTLDTLLSHSGLIIIVVATIVYLRRMHFICADQELRFSVMVMKNFDHLK